MKISNPKDKTESLLRRSQCSVRVAALIIKKGQLVSNGWNHVGPDGLGAHAEREAIRRANKKELRNATMYVAGVRVRNGRAVNAKPCDECLKAIKKHKIQAVYRDPSHNWRKL